MNTAALPLCGTHEGVNTERWIAYYATTSKSERERLLREILQFAESDDECWRVFEKTIHSRIQEDALQTALKFACTLEDLWRIHLCADEDLRARVMCIIELCCTLILTVALNNRARWDVWRYAPDSKMRERALLEILNDNPTHGEQWMIFFKLEARSTKERVLRKMLRSINEQLR